MIIFNKLWEIIELIIRFVVYMPLIKMGIRITEKQWNTFVQFVKFGIVGLSNTFVAYLTYLIFLLLETHYLVGSVTGFVVSVLNSFYWNNKYVFKTDDIKHRSVWKVLIKTFMSYAFTGLILSNLLLVLWIDILNVAEVIAPLINLIITIPLNFVIVKLWSFK